MTYVTIEDGIEILQLSNRTINALKRVQIHTIGDMFDFPTEEFANVRNLGAKSIAEITTIIDSLKRGTNDNFRLLDIRAVESENTADNPSERDIQLAEEMSAAFGENPSKWLREIMVAEHEHAEANDSAFLYWVYKSPVLRNAVKGSIIKRIDDQAECSMEDLIAACPQHLQRTSVLKEILTEMEAEHTISLNDGVATHIFPSVVSYANLIKDERRRDIFIARLNGSTLEEIGQRYGLTRERVRQIIGKVLLKKPRFMEDKYLYLYENYDFSLEDFKLAFGESDTTYYYLEEAASRSRAMRRPIIEVLQDENIPVKLRKQAERAIYKEYVLIDGVRILKQRREIVEYVIRTKCKELTKFDDFVELYHAQLRELGLDDDPKLEMESRTYENTLHDADYVLWNQWRSFRYYYIPEREYDQLLSALDIQQYQNTELSTLKFFRDYPDLMQEYDIRDEYELHNLLKKVWPEDDTSVEFKRMPTIVIGNADRDTQVLDLLLQFAPISLDDLAKEYEIAYGAKAATAIGTYFKNFTEYYFEGVYSINADNLPAEQFDRMKRILTDEYYPISQIKDIYQQEFPGADEAQINPYTLKTLGFKVYSGYVVSAQYSNAADYFHKVLSASDQFDVGELPTGLMSIPSFTQVLAELRAKREIFEYAPRKYVSKNFLQSLGITEAAINDYFSSVLRFASGKPFFTVASLRDDGFVHKIGSEDFEDWFYSSLIVEERESFSYKRMGRTKVFAIGKTQVSFGDMIVWIISQHQRMTYAALNRHLETRYGIFLQKDKLLGIIHETSLYYDPIMEEIYISYDAYCE